MSTQSAVLSRVMPWVVGTSEADWDVLYRDQLPRVYNYFRYRVGETDAEDLTSITFERAWRARHRYRRDRAGFTTWLLAIAHNAAVDHYRRRVESVSLDTVQEVSGGETPEEITSRASDFERLSVLLSQLSERERELLALRYGAGLTNRAIARMTDLSESNVGTILHRAVADLRARWHGENER